MDRGLIERSERNGSEWWNVRFNQIDGPKPEFRQFMKLDQEIQAIGDYCRNLIQVQRVQPSDICLIYNGGNIKYRLETQVAPALTDLGVELSVQTNKSFERSNNILLATTSHPFKGYDSEVVVIPAIDQYIAKDIGILANDQYVAMTRARSILTLFAQRRNNEDAETIYEVIADCLGNEHRKWLDEMWNRDNLFISQEPLITDSGEIIAEPLFRVLVGEKQYACFGSDLPRQRIRRRVEDNGVQLLVPGQKVTLE